MSSRESLAPSQYIHLAFEESDRIALLALNRLSREALQRIISAGKAASPELQAWLRRKNATGSDIYIGMNPLKPEAATRTKQDIESIRHLYMDLDYGGPRALEEVLKSSLVPKASFVLGSSPGKFQVVWRVEGISLGQAEALLRALAREFGGDPAATDATRVLRLPGFANKKYENPFVVDARRESVDTYHLQDFRLQIDGQESLYRSPQRRRKCQSSSQPLSQSEHDWTFAKRALSRGDDPESVIRQIADYRSTEKSDPEYYARLTVEKASAQLGKSPPESSSSAKPPLRAERD